MLEQVRAKWVALVAKERDSFGSILAREPFVDWELNTAPEETAEDQLKYALVLRYGQVTGALVEAFLNRCFAILDRMREENLLESPKFPLPEIPPIHKATWRRARTFALVLLGKPLDHGALREAAPDFLAWALDGDWDAMTEHKYLQAVRLLLIAGDVEKCAELLQTRKRFEWHGEQAESLRELVRASAFPVRDEAILERFDVVFNPLRHPDVRTKAFTEVAKTRLELGAIRDKYFVSTDGTIDWDRTIDAISY
jgi:hypothetical protein